MTFVVSDDSLWLRFALSDINIAALAFICLVVAWDICCFPPVSLYASSACSCGRWHVSAFFLFYSVPQSMLLNLGIWTIYIWCTYRSGYLHVCHFVLCFLLSYLSLVSLTFLSCFLVYELGIFIIIPSLCLSACELYNSVCYFSAVLEFAVNTSASSQSLPCTQIRKTSQR